MKGRIIKINRGFPTRKEKRDINKIKIPDKKELYF